MSKIEKNCNYIHERAQKITEALYRVTELFPREEPLKWFLRERGIKIFNTTIKINGTPPHERIKFIDEVSAEIPKMTKMLELASVGSFISQNNFEVLRREYGELCKFINSKRSDFLPEPMVLLPDKDAHLKEHNLKKANLEKANAKEPQLKEAEQEIKQEIKQETAPPLSMGQEDIGHNTAKKSNSPSLNPKRKERIINYVERKGWVSVGDIAKELFEGEISSKTVQRDLSALTRQGVLQKEGDKRWRRYGLVV